MIAQRLVGGASRGGRRRPSHSGQKPLDIRLAVGWEIENPVEASQHGVLNRGKIVLREDGHTRADGSDAEVVTLTDDRLGAANQLGNG